MANLLYKLSFHSFLKNSPLQKSRKMSIKAYEITHLFKHYHVEVDGSSAVCFHFRVQPNKRKTIMLEYVFAGQCVYLTKESQAKS